MSLLFAAWIVLLSGAVLAMVFGGFSRIAAQAGWAGAVVGCSLGLVDVGRRLFSGQYGQSSIPWPIPGAAFSLNLDLLACFFLLPLFLVGLLGALYGLEYRGVSTDKAWRHWGFYNLLILSMSLVLTAANGMLFLFAWECMSVSSFFLVVEKYQKSEVVRAGLVYLVATHLGAAFLFGFFLAAGSVCGSLEFSAFQPLHNVSPLMASALFLTLLIGFGSKAGMFPLHIWLPEAHPAAPSHVSALMSGVMVKIAIYGIIRFLAFLPAAPAWWGLVMIVAGIVGALFGIGMAAGQTDIKRCLAYSTVENVGILFMALGFWLYAGATGNTLAGVFALLGALLHIWNHAMFKSLLFLGAGSVVHATGSHSMDRMGGLLRRMPYTGVAMIGGSMAVAALPPFNGLVGEFFIYRSLLESSARLQGIAPFLPIVLTGLLAMVGGMAILVFVRLNGIVLAGEPRHPQASEAREVGVLMRGSMLVLCLACLVCGLVPVVLVKPLVRVATYIDPATVVLPGADFGAIRWLGIAGGGVMLLVLFFSLLSRSWRLPESGVRPSTWGCGFRFPSARMSYSAAGFAELAQNTLFCKSLRPVSTTSKKLELFPETVDFFHAAPDAVLEHIAAPSFATAAAGCNRLRALQAGNLHIYLLYIFSVTTLLLLWMFFQ